MEFSYGIHRNGIKILVKLIIFALMFSVKARTKHLS